jgi:prepilin-type N-terminal cleavage/methylation domain-containing protein
MTNRHSHGLTLVEVLMAIVIVLVVIPSIGAMYFYAGSQSDEYVREAEAARLAEAIRAYAADECVDPATGRVTDGVIRNENVPQTTLYGQPAMLPAALGRFQARLVWELRVEKGAEDRGVVQHICTATIANDIDRDGAARNVLSAGDDVLLTSKWHLYDTAP